MSEITEEMLIEAIINVEDRSEKVISEGPCHKTIEYKVAQYEPGGKGWWFKTVQQTLNYKPLYIKEQPRQRN